MQSHRVDFSGEQPSFTPQIPNFKTSNLKPQTPHPQRLSLPNSLSGAWGVVVPQLNSRPSTSASANHRFVPSPPRSPSLLPQPPLSPSLNSQNPSAKPGGMPSPHPHTRPTSSTIYGRYGTPSPPPLSPSFFHSLTPPPCSPSRVSQRMTGRAKSGKFVSGGHLRGLLDRWETHSPAHQQPHAARFSIMPRHALRFVAFSSAPHSPSLLGLIFATCFVCVPFATLKFPILFQR